MSINLNKSLIESTEETQELLKGLQGNILKGHGRDHAMHLFICFGNPINAKDHNKSLCGAKDWIGKTLAKRVTNAFEQYNDPDKQQILSILLLSSQGYEFLGERRPKDGAFRDGIRDRREKLNDPMFQQWSPKYKFDEKDVHALIIVAVPEIDETAATASLDKIKSEIEGELASFGGFILVDQRGHQKRDGTPKNRAVEHFGYADGVSQPQFFDDGKSNQKKFNQVTPLKIVLEKDRHGDGGYGSFFVYRLLEQNVDSWNAAVAKVANQLDPANPAPGLVGAMAVGRFKNGTPLTTYGSLKPDYEPKNDEDFDYKDDEDGNKCPYHAHIRKVNPRDSLGFITNLLARERKRRIARRGITYFDKENNTVGLIFMCFQSDIKDQFEFMQRRWANNHSFSKRGTGLDPVVGQDGGPQESNDFPDWPKEYDSNERERIRFDEHVRFLGGEYFFAPSISGLNELAKI